MTRLRDYTMARVGLGRAGRSLPTDALLDFQLAHAQARDAVRWPLDIHAVMEDVRALGYNCIEAASQCPDRETYLRRPDLGRRLDPESRSLLTAGRYDAAFVIAGGLSALAIHRHAAPLLAAILPKLEGWRIAPFTVVRYGRVAIGDEIGEALGAALVVILIGERPGLTSPDSLGAYLTWNPSQGRTDAGRNCVSNIRPQGLSYEAAAGSLLYLMTESRRRRLSGVALKDETGMLTDDAVLRGFENGTFPKEQWNHAAHLRVAACYLLDHPREEALRRMREGVPRYNEATGGRNTEDSGYHETLTRFWIAIAGAYLDALPVDAPRQEKIAAVVREFGSKRDYYRDYYSYDVLQSRAARRDWVAPDLKPLPYSGFA